MSDREALAAALKKPWPVHWEKSSIIAAARERLAQLPEKCGKCGGKGTIYKVENDGSRSGRMCSVCHGSGKVYLAELVELIASAIYAGSYSGGYQEQALAVLDALGETE